MDESKQEQGETLTTMPITSDTNKKSELQIVGNYAFTPKQLEDLARLAPEDWQEYKPIGTCNFKKLTAEEIAKQLSKQVILSHEPINHQPSGRCNLGITTGEEISEQEALRNQRFASMDGSYFNVVHPYQGTVPIDDTINYFQLSRSHPIAILGGTWTSTNGGPITRIDSENKKSQ